MLRQYPTIGANPMRAVEISRYGGPEVLQVVEAEQPQPAAGEVLIKVAAAGVNRPDCIQRAGFYPPPPGASPLPGLEVAGEIAECGSDASRFAKGDRVCALLSGGGYAGYAVAPEGQCLPVPAGLDLAEAAALPETCFTVWSNVFDRAALQSGQSLFIRGGGGGIGTTAIQMAANLGAQVIATAGGEDKAALCRALGAVEVIDYQREEAIAEKVLKATGGRGADVILDMVGGDAIAEHIACAAEDGCIVSIGFLGGSRTEVDLMPVMLKRLTLTGSTLRPRPPAFKAAIARRLEEHIWPSIAAGRIRPHIHCRLPLAEAAEAHRIMEGGEHSGKILLLP